ncbi:ABC transporter permease [Leisingera sp. HS039]|uniref:ABC transporter permease n=2 Tax=unclassified Leisingera TaxID=2614906 RepID=UPI00197D9272|nr:ABC transporter permease [Leisingera sp. HS039]
MINTLFILAYCAIFLLTAASVAWVFRKVLTGVAPPRFGKLLQHVPLTASFGMLIVILYVIIAVFAPVLAPFGEREVVGQQYLPWDGEFLLGTDNLGRDMLSRLIYGARNSVGIALVTTLITFFLGTSLGLLAATLGGWVDQVISRIVDVIIAIPALIFALLLLSIVGTSIVNMIVVISFIEATRVYRLARSVTLNVVVLDYVEAAKLRGDGLFRLIFREILPNITAPLVAEFGLRFCFVFLAVSTLSFLGLGIQPPTADWGSMVRDNATLISFGDITPLLPAAAIALLTIAINFIVDWMLHVSSGLKE